MPASSSFAPAELGDLKVQYVRRRRILRVVRTGDPKNGSVEVPLPAFLDALGIEPADLAPTRHFLLFAGLHHRPAGGLGDLSATFADEAEVREAFRRLRLSADYREGWAQVVEVTSGGRARALCWFGREPSRGNLPEPAPHVPPVERSPTWRSRWRSAARRSRPQGGGRIVPERPSPK